MDYSKTQISKLTEQVKEAMLAHTPVVYIPTDQMEVVDEMLFGANSSNALVPRLWVKADGSKSLMESHDWGIEENGKFKSIEDNYKVGAVDADRLKVPSLIINYANDWGAARANIKKFIQAYLGIKSSNAYLSPVNIDTVRKSLYLMVTPKEEKIPEELAPYVRIVRVPALTDDEIKETIFSVLKSTDVPSKIISGKLLSQMTVSFRGFSARRITSMIQQMITEQDIDFDAIDEGAVMSIIRSSKKQLLENSQGLKWENTKISGVAGLDNITKWLADRVEIFKDPELARRQHMDIPKGVLISGIPGSGKSLMAKTTATILDMPLISLDMGALLGGIMGESEHNMINALSMAEHMAPCVLWIDEIEKAFSGSSQGSSSSDGGVGRRMFGKFLTWMQEKSAACFVFATSNDISGLPPELFRAERFDRKFFTFMPMADECAKIFAANISAQNRAYVKELDEMPISLQAKQAKQLFASSLERPEFWLDIINDCCTDDVDSCELVNKNEGKTDSDGQPLEPVYVWNTTSMPKNKLMTGADISSLIKEAKFLVHPSPLLSAVPPVIYGENQMGNAVRQIMRSKSFKPYGETNLKDIVICFMKLHENEFVPASGKCIINFEQYDTDAHIYKHDTDKVWENVYDKVLYYTIVGAINHYSAKLKV